MKPCPNCKKEVDGNATYCPHCGKVVSWLKIINQPWINDTHTGTWWDKKIYRILPLLIFAAVLVFFKFQLKPIISTMVGRLFDEGPKYESIAELKAMTCKEYTDSSIQDKTVISNRLYTDKYGSTNSLSQSRIKLKYDAACIYDPDLTLGQQDISR